MPRASKQVFTIEPDLHMIREVKAKAWLKAADPSLMPFVRWEQSRHVFGNNHTTSSG